MITITSLPPSLLPPPHAGYPPDLDRPLLPPPPPPPRSPPPLSPPFPYLEFLLLPGEGDLLLMSAPPRVQSKWRQRGRGF